MRRKLSFFMGLILAVILFTGETLNSQTAYDCLLKARILMADGKNGEAVTCLVSGLAANRDGRLFSAKAEAETAMGDVNSAISDYLSASSMGDTEAEFGLAKAYALKGDAAGSVSHLENSMKSASRKSEKEIMLEPSFRKIENTPEWRAFWKKDWYTGKEKSLAEIEYYVAGGKTSEAISALAELENNYGGTSAVDYASALISFSAGKYQDALKDLSGLLETDPSNEKYLRLMAKAQESSGNPAGASDTYSKLLEMQVPDAGLLISRAENYRKTGETDKARADIKRYLELVPDSKSALSMAGKIESSTGNNLEALGYFNRNLQLHPDDPDCYIDRANSYFLSKSWDWAAKDYSMALDLSPGNPDTWLNKGLALVNSGNTDDACHDFRQALRLGSKKAADLVSRYCIK